MQRLKPSEQFKSRKQNMKDFENTVSDSANQSQQKKRTTENPENPEKVCICGR